MVARHEGDSVEKRLTADATQAGFGNVSGRGVWHHTVEREVCLVEVPFPISFMNFLDENKRNDDNSGSVITVSKSIHAIYRRTFLRYTSTQINNNLKIQRRDGVGEDAIVLHCNVRRQKCFFDKVPSIFAVCTY